MSTGIRHVGRVGTFALICFIASGCSQPERDPAPVHDHAVCSEPARSGSLRCDQAIRATMFDEWASGAVWRPGSTFSVWIAGDDWKSWQRLLVVRVPRSWGPNVMAAKADLLRTARERAAATHLLSPDQQGLPPGAQPSNPGDPGKRRLVVVTATGTMKINRGAFAAGTALHRAVVCDRSDSTLGSSCSPQALRAIFDNWIDQGGLVIGSTFAVWVPGKGRDSTSRAITVATPDAPLGARAAAVLGAGRELDRQSTVATPGAGSAIAEAINVAGEHLKAKKGRRQLLILSDMRQHTPGQWDFERKAPEPADFVIWLKEEQLLLDLAGVDLAVCGAHHHHGPNAPSFDARLAANIANVWRATFKAMEMKPPGSWTGCLKGEPNG